MSLSMIDARIPHDSLGIWWLGQAGFVFKTPVGKIVYVDPYLSDAAERLHGFKRLSLPPIEAEQVRADLVVLTHEHTDHLDPDALPIIVRNNPACRFAAPAGCTQGLTEAGVAADARVTLEPHRQYEMDGVVIHTAPADHGDLSASALCLLFDFDGVRVLCTGDTAFRPQLLKPLYGVRPDVLLPCINGVFGNMNHIDAAMLVQQVRPRYAVPCHYWTFAEHGAGDPGGFIHACRQFCAEVNTAVLKPGERFLCNKPS
jgi:L-ascorbate 6-phosphate lactonase